MILHGKHTFGNGNYWIGDGRDAPEVDIGFFEGIQFSLGRKVEEPTATMGLNFLYRFVRKTGQWTD